MPRSRENDLIESRNRVSKLLFGGIGAFEAVVIAALDPSPKGIATGALIGFGFSVCSYYATRQSYKGKKFDIKEMENELKDAM